jgi:glyoxylase I family protein
MKLNKIHHVAIICSDYEKSKDFYVNLLGLKIINEYYRSERSSFKLDLAVGENTMIELFSFPDPPQRLTKPEAAGMRHLAFEVDNMNDTVSELKVHQIAVEPIRIDPLTGKKYTFFSDPDQLPIELYEKSTEKIKAIFHIDELEKWDLLLTNVKNLLIGIDNLNQEATIEVLANSKAVMYYIEDPTHHNDRLEELSKKGVYFTACNNALNSLKIEKERLYPFITIVPIGVKEIIEKERVGYAYLKP